MKDIKDNRKGFYRYSSSERETGNNVGVLTNVVGDQLRESMCYSLIAQTVQSLTVLFFFLSTTILSSYLCLNYSSTTHTAKFSCSVFRYIQKGIGNAHINWLCSVS